MVKFKAGAIGNGEPIGDSRISLSSVQIENTAGMSLSWVIGL